MTGTQLWTRQKERGLHNPVAARSAVLLWFVTFALFACESTSERAEPSGQPERVAPGGDEVGKADFAASALLWPSPRLAVCWESDTMISAHEQAREWVEDAVVGSWPAVSAVELLGWGPCASDFRGIRVGLTDAAPHTLGLGTELDGLLSGMRLNFTFESWSPDCQQTREFCVRAGAIHEFGHALGLAHEQNRPDTPGWCAGERGAFGDLSFTDWDLDSIMNYCNPEWTGGGDLSESDVIAIRALYGFAAGTALVAVGDGTTLAPRGADAQATPAAQAQAFANRSEGATLSLGDVTGDGRAELVTLDEVHGQWWVRRAVTNDFGSAELFAEWTGTTGATSLLGDLDGDGLADAIDVTSDGIWTVGASNGSSFGAPRWLGQHESGGVPRVGDLNGDGRDDAVMVDPSNGRWWVALSVGTGLAPFQLWADGHGAKAATHLVADVTGDARADLIVAWAGTGRWEVAVSQGDSMRPTEVWAEGHGGLAHARFVEDLDGDGRGDALVYERTRGRWFARLATGSTFGEERYLGEYLGASRAEVAPVVVTGDINGDHRGDVVLNW